MANEPVDSTEAIDDDWLKPPASTLGLHQVYPDPKLKSKPIIDVVFVHGLGGDSYSTWTKDKSLWIRDLLPQSELFQNARIMTFGYDARAFLTPFASQYSHGRVFVFAEALLSDLKDKRAAAAAKKRPIIFVAHSLGGIVVKSALRHAHMLPGLYGDILQSTNAIVFFGTPHQGSDLAVWASFLGGLGRVVRLRNTRVVDDLKRWSNPLVELTTAFAEMWERFDITTFYETKKTHGVMMVPEGAAKVGQKNEQARALLADHVGVCKFSVDDPNWVSVQGRLNAVAEKIYEQLEVETNGVKGDSIEDLEQRLKNIKGLEPPSS
ncbi:hypothetical protein CORC01_07187 [Colletotrichum orchidophilum]|uniref:AB hydrolase-1 domain-containing protein n=1 Tax=Colletotrichum orchidophilum TaxID=1209926 RepID=A0A1G4B8H9_9PEZI|nr:uncharacterized protein CORC01_07187 [Colletotrichum orchidophilum]OHE97572.1 hypothetical protein CORC01_07187 [Colletotrichum orchidophilum]